MMRRSFYLSFFLFLTLFFIVNYSFVYANEPKVAERWICLDSKRCDREDTPCSDEKNPHRVKLAVKPDEKLLPNKDSYIIECVETDNGQICTTGDSTLDETVFEDDNVMELSDVVGYKFEGLTNSQGNDVPSPVKSNGSGELSEPLEWQSSTPISRGRKFVALNYLDDLLVQGDAGGLQQGIFTFEGAKEKCLSIRWDPYGRVFDSQNLEPIKGAEVILQVKDVNGVFSKYHDPLGAVNNPNYSADDGSFSFVVPDGVYRLMVNYSGYSFPFESSGIATNYSKVYSDIYYANGIANFTNQDIIQQGSIVHRDIPLDPNGISRTAPFKLIGYSQSLDKSTDKVIIEGRASHPFAESQVYSKVPKSVNSETFVPSKLLISQKTDEFGVFNISIDQSELKLPEVCCSVKLIKTDLTKDLSSSNINIFDKFVSWFKRKVDFFPAEAVQQKQETSFDLDPILNYIEGYAYDSRGNVVPNADIGIYLNFSKKAYFKTKANENGYYKISSEYLPSMPYKIKYMSSKGMVSNVSTSKFVAQNRSFITKNKVDIYDFKDKDGFKLSQSIVPTKVKKQARDFIDKDHQPVDQRTESQATPSQNRSQLVLMVMVLVVLIVVVGGFLAFYLLKKRQNEQSSEEISS